MRGQFVDADQVNLIDKEKPADDHKSKFNFTPVVLMIALSCHALFEGLAVGLGKDSKTVWTLCLAICLHKWAEAMSLGISL